MSLEKVVINDDGSMQFINSKGIMTDIVPCDVCGINMVEPKFETCHTCRKNHIKSIRKQTGLNAEKFGALIGVGKKTVESWEQGVRNPSGPALKMLETIGENK